MAHNYTTTPPTRSTTDVTIDDDTFTFTFPQTSGMLLDLSESKDGIGRFSAIIDWFNAGLSDDDADRIKARLRDPDDGLDTTLLTTIVTDLIAEASGSPTG